ncbi:MAG: hypothetical protein KDK91_11505 [Gammaproteobacteria bacterium]|nr:hypothetical protein [Gammaproteobacteria bacterium]
MSTRADGMARGGRRRIRGQASVLALLLLGVAVICALSLYKSGRLATDKMALQNAADAVAYSVSTVEARDLNFAAYMNRSIVANEVAIAQMVGLASWAQHTNSFHDHLRSYDTVIAQPLASNPFTAAVGAPMSAALKGMAGVFKGVGTVLDKTFKPLAQAFSIVSHGTNYAYGVSQTVFHYASLMQALGVVQEMIDRNGPDGAGMSDYGVLSLISHLATFAELPGFPGTQYTRSYDPTEVCSKRARDRNDESCDSARAYERLAAITLDSRDNFSRNRGWELQFFKVLRQMGIVPSWLTFDLRDRSGKNRTWLGINFSKSLDLGIAEVRFGMRFGIYFDLARDGGSELRHVRQSNDATAGKYFNWSAADGTNMGIGITGRIFGGIFACLPLVGCVQVAGIPDCQATAVNDELNFSCSVWGLTIGPPPIFFPTTAPLATGYAEVGVRNVNDLKSDSKHMGLADRRSPFGRSGPVPREAYGDVPTRENAWFGLPFTTVPPYNQENRNGSRGIYDMASWNSRRIATYRGLPPYIDTTDEVTLAHSGGPYIVVGLELGEAAFDRNNWSDASKEPKGRFALDNGLARERATVIAKAEVWFKRPNDISYFRRGDRYEEHGSTFNPYWQARLVETSHADRAIALAIQQGQGEAPPYAVAEFNEFMDNVRDAVDAAAGAAGL